MQARTPSNQAVDTKEADPRLKRAKPRSERLLSLTGRATCGILMAVAGLLALPAQAQAQAQVLVSNVGQNSQGVGEIFDFDQAQAFTTGSKIAGYTLTSVEIDMGADTDYSTAFTVSVHSNNNERPGTSLGTLSNPTSMSRDDVYAFTTRGIALAGSATYFVVIDRTGYIDAAHDFYIKNTNSLNQDPGRASGWSIGNGSLYRDWNSRGSWTPFLDPKKIRVNGINPGVSNASISIADATGAENADHVLFDVTLSRSLPNAAPRSSVSSVLNSNSWPRNRGGLWDARSRGSGSDGTANSSTIA